MGHDDFYLAFKGCLYETRTRSKNKMDDFYPASKIKLDNFCTACTSTYLFIYLSIYLLHVYMYIYMCVFVCVCACACACACLCKILEIMYRLPKMRKKPIGARFTVVSKNCCAKALLFNMQNFEND